MAEPFSLDEGGCDRLYEELTAGVRGYLPEWTDAYAASPTVTLAETMAWLTDMQRFYLDQITDGHRLRLLALLGGQPQERRAAQGLLCPERHGPAGVLPGGSLFYAGAAPFETNWPVWYDGAQAVRWEGDAANSFCLRFAAPLPADAWFALYVEPGDGAFCGALRWSFWNGSAWERVAQVRDETAGFSQNGFVRLRLGAVDSSCLRLRCEAEAAVPVLAVRCDLVAVTQRRTDADDRRQLEPRAGGQRPLTGGDGRWRRVRDAAQRPCTLRTEPPAWDTEGVAGQRIPLDPDILPDELRLAVTDGADGWLDCPINPPPAPEQPTAMGCRYDPLARQLVLGDGRDFLIPRRQKGGLRAVCLRRSLGAAGNFPAGTALTGPEGFCGTLPFGTAGGAEMPPAAQQLETYCQKLLRPLRAVTAADLERLLRKTPGVCVRRVKVLAQDGAVRVVLQTADGCLSEPARRAIETYLCPRLPLGMTLRLSLPVRERVEVWAQLVPHTAGWTRDDEAAAHEAVRRCVEETTDIGGTLTAGQLCAALEELPGVRRVTQAALRLDGGRLLRLTAAPDAVLALGGCGFEVVRR